MVVLRQLCLPAYFLLTLNVINAATLLGPAATKPSTCAARAVNYVTHRLPQQCLKSTWTAPTATALNSTADASASNSTTYVAKPHSSINESSIVNDTISRSSTRDSTQVDLPPPAKTLVSNDSSSSDDIPSTSKPEETDSSFDTDNFLSFEEWKRKNNIRSSNGLVGKQNTDNSAPRKKPVVAHNDLDTLGDYVEIDLDFSAFVGEKPRLPQNAGQTASSDSSGHTPDTEMQSTKPKRRNKDAGTTCKERFNYASFDCAATILKTNSKASSSSSVLIENKDSYMLNECSADNKFIILELCGDILIDTVALANFEFFSSMFRTFRVSVSNRYPVKLDKWQALGTFEARNSREVQAFLVENPVMWARYVRIEFLTHYGNEFYCPVSLVRVHGTTMMEDYRRDAEEANAEEDDEEASPEITAEQAEAGEVLIPDAKADVLVEEDRSRHVPTYLADQEPNLASVTAEPTIVLSTSFDKMRNDLERMSDVFLLSQSTCSIYEGPCEPTNHIPEAPVKPVGASTATSSQANAIRIPETELNSTKIVEVSGTIVTNNTTVRMVAQSSRIDTNQTSSSVAHPTSKSTILADSNTNSTKVVTTNATEASKQTSSSTQAQPASPTVQESFFKSVQKRLQMLESNSSLSLQYIEEQSRLLREAFNRVEQRQLNKTNTFLINLNTTVLSELRDFRQQYDQLWQSTVIELEMQREKYQYETIALHTRLTILADELVFQKRLSILQSFLVLLCLGLVLFSRGAMNTYLEMPNMQGLLARTPSRRFLRSPLVSSPADSPVGTRPNSQHRSKSPSYSILKKGHQRNPSQDSEGDLSPVMAYSPPTPTSFDEASDAEKQLDRLGSPTPNVDALQRPSSSPPVLPNGEDPEIPILHQWRDEGTVNGGFEEPDVTPTVSRTPKVLVQEATPPRKLWPMSMSRG